MPSESPSAVTVFFRRFFIAVGVMTTLLFLTAAALVAHALRPMAMPDKILLTYNFKSSLPEVPLHPSLSNPTLHVGPTFHDVAQALQDAASDARVKGFAARIEDGARFSAAQVQELRDLIHKFRKAGKFATVYSSGFSGPGMSNYYLAASFDTLWLQPVGVVAINGVGAEVPFVKGLLDKVGVNAQFNHKGIYKSAPESLTRTGMSAPHREMMNALIGDLAGQMEAGISADRKISPEDLRRKMDGSPFGDAEALKEKLVDRVGYADEMLDDAKKLAGVDDDGVVTLGDYDPPKPGDRPGARKYPDKKDAKIALITGTGDIVAAGDRSDMAADKMVSAFREAMKDKDVAAVVFRIDSPGGSPEAAESIRRAVIETQKKGKPVVVSMGGYAASGGYWVATPADKIVAEPATITGSIGVFGGKIEVSGLWSKLGVNWDSVAEGQNALMWSSNRPFTEAEMARFESMLDGIYSGFIARVAEGRHLTKAQVEAVAEGRVWTGRQAKERGLVDDLGGLDLAVAHAKRLAKLDPLQDIPLVEFPAPKSPLQLLASLAKNDEEDVSVFPLDLSADDVFKAALNRLRAQNGILRLPYMAVN